MKNVQLGKLIVGEEFPPLCVAEICNNMRGSKEVALEMVRQAAAVGVDIVKGQMRFQTGRLSQAAHADLMEACSQRGILYGCTAFDEKGADVLAEMQVPVIKVGSGQVTDLDFLRYVAKKRIPMLVSTGGCELGDVGAAWQMLVAQGTPFMFMQCTSMYPTPYHRVNLGAIPRMRRLYEVHVGLSCHTATIYTGIAAVGYGARVIEKHFTLDREQPGPDQICSLEPNEMQQMVQGVRAAYMARGAAKIYFPEERLKLGAIRDAQKPAPRQPA